MSNTLPTVQRTAGPVQTAYGVNAPPTSRIAAYVRSAGVQDGDDPFIRSGLVATLDAALARCRPGLGDVVYVLPGHEEDLSGADALPSLQSGTYIVGLGDGSLRPTFTFSAALSSVLLDVAGVSFQNCIFECAGDPVLTAALSVAGPFVVSAAGCSFVSCSFQVSIDADQLATICINTTAAAKDLSLIGCEFYGATAGEVTTVVNLIGADRFKCIDTTIQAATSAVGTGVMRFITTASLNCLVQGGAFVNRKALSSSAVLGHATSSGVWNGVAFGVLVATAGLAGLTNAGLMQRFNCKTCNLAAENGADSTPVSA